MQVVTWLYVAVAVVLLLGTSVFVHEFGHFWMARQRGLRVEGFSIGFGPKLFGCTRDGVQCAWRLIPAGGFVTLPQMITSEIVEGETKVKEPLPPVSPGSKILVALARPVMNVAFAFGIATLIYFVGLPVLINPPIIGGVEPGSPEARLGIRAGDRVMAVNGHPVKSWEDLQMTVAMAPTNVLRVTIARNGVRTTCLLPATMNKSLGVKLLDLEPTERPVIERVFPGSPAQRGGLQAADEVVFFAGVPVVGQQQLVKVIKKRPGIPCPIEVRRANHLLKLTVTPEHGPLAKTSVIGVMLGANMTSVYEAQKPGPPPWNLVAQVCQLTYGTIAALIHSGRTGVEVKDLSGPPGMLAMVAVEVKADYRLALKFIVLLNVGLALLNLLPIPVLDGGHTAIAIEEQVRGRPPNWRSLEYATMLFTTLLISFMLYVSYNDIARRFPLFKNMLNQQVQIEPGSGATNGPTGRQGESARHRQGGIFCQSRKAPTLSEVLGSCRWRSALGESKFVQGV